MAIRSTNATPCQNCALKCISPTSTEHPYSELHIIGSIIVMTRNLSQIVRKVK